MDSIFDVLGFSERKKIIYEFLAAILHLSNIEFQNTEPDKTGIVETSIPYVDFAAELLKLSPDDLKNVLLYRSIQVSGSEIT